jgi:hypothetical protein
VLPAARPATFLSTPGSAPDSPQRETMPRFSYDRLVDARTDLAGARAMCQRLAATGPVPVVAVVAEGGLVAVDREWGIAIPSVKPGEHKPTCVARCACWSTQRGG